MPEALLTINEAAAALKCSRRWLDGWLASHPYYHLIGTRKRFTQADMVRIIEALECRSSSSHRARRRLTGGCAGHGSESILTAALRLATER